MIPIPQFFESVDRDCGLVVYDLEKTFEPHFINLLTTLFGVEMSLSNQERIRKNRVKKINDP